MKATFEKVINGFILETKDGKNVIFVGEKGE